jgi:hypothetical protein
MAKGEDERPTAREGVLYFGRVAAGLSHELSNVLNIINELAGLQRDIAAAAVEGGGDARFARFADLAQRIKTQVSRGEAINRGLHRFAHSVDNADTSFDLGSCSASPSSRRGRRGYSGGADSSSEPGSPLRRPLQPVAGAHACVGAARAWRGGRPRRGARRAADGLDRVTAT